jgi:preprotein translocase subunit SecA
MTASAVRRLLLIETPPYPRARREVADGLRAPVPDGTRLDTAFRDLGMFGPGFDTARAVALFTRACLLATGMSPRPGQLAGGLVMARGAIAEMDTGEGKTIAAAFASCLLASGGRGVHSVTVNAYLAERDHGFLRPLYSALGFTSSLLRADMTPDQRRTAYAADIVHGTNAEFVFDSLRDGIALSRSSVVQRGHAAAVVDEADSVLLDEASTPLVLSDGAGSVSTMASFCDSLVSGFEEGTDFERDIEDGSVHLTALGTDRAEAAMHLRGHLPTGWSLYDGRSDALGFLTAAMKARFVLRRDTDYILRDGRVEIVDVNTGRVLDGRRYADGLHEAVEIKERVGHSGSGDTVSSTTYMNYFARYGVLCGTTGTAMSSSSEILKLYRTPTVRVPPHRQSLRRDRRDTVHGSVASRNRAAVDEAIALHAGGRPVLIGTASVAESVEIARLLDAAGFSRRTESVPAPETYALLNASEAAHEAAIVASAGRLHALTVATNMAGRGTDIELGGGHDGEREAVEALGGLHVVGVGRHVSRRIDDQLRGRAGRRGEPGSTAFHVSIEDDLLVRHTSTAPSLIRRYLSQGDFATLERLFAQAQRVADALGADRRETMRQYAAVDIVQTEAFHGLRREFMEAADTRSAVADMRAAAIMRTVEDFAPVNTYADHWDVGAMRAALLSLTAIDFPVTEWATEDFIKGQDVIDRVMAALPEVDMEPETVRQTVLSAFDACWREHMARLEVLRRAVAFRTYALLQPLTEYRVESFPLFARLVDDLKARAVSAVSWAYPGHSV